MSGELTRRGFLKAVAGGVVSAGAAAAAQPGIPRRPLGRTGLQVSVLGLGGGSNFLSAARNADDALAILNACLEGGVNYFDTADSYGRGASERYYGLAAKQHRDRMIIATKTQARTRDEALRSVEESLKRLQTDHVDVMQIHSITPADTLASLAGKDGVFTALQELKAQKVVRCIGITGHSSAVTMRALVEKLEGLDTALYPINAGRDERDPRAGRGAWKTPQPDNPEGHMEISLLPACREMGIGVIAMKTTAYGMLIGEGPGRASAGALIRYSMSVPGVSAAIVGPRSLEQMRQNIALAQGFTPMGEDERRRLSAHLAGALRDAAYLRPGYQDGQDGRYGEDIRTA